MLVFDTSSIVYAWDNYPIAQFPNLWNWLASEFSSGHILLPEVVFAEVENVAPECSLWLDEQEVGCLSMNDAIVAEALRLKELLEIGARYEGGVGENDLFIIATASEQGVELVSNESFQKTLPKRKGNYKIPTVCSLDEVKVPCCTFLEFMKRSGTVFG